MSTVSIAGLAGSASFEVNEDATIADVKAAASVLGIDLNGLTLRLGGRTVSDDEPVPNGSVVVGTPPEAKHGSR